MTNQAQAGPSGQQQQKRHQVVGQINAQDIAGFPVR